MRVLVLYAHPVETSFCAELHGRVLERLAAAGHDVDDRDLYAEGFDPVLSRDERLAYHDVPANRAAVAGEAERVLAAQAVVLVFPVWNFGFPAILKGYLDRVFLPGVSFRLEEGTVRPNLSRLERIVAVTSYGAPRWKAFLAGDPPRRIVTRVLPGLAAPRARVVYHALYDMNRAGAASRERFLARVGAAMERL